MYLKSFKTIFYPDLKIAGEGGEGEGRFVLPAMPAFLPSVIFSFFTQNKRGARPPGPFP